ncbi:UbiA family prenyltransferase [Thalassobaculum salexigens]|uniref:UbiA family prenyltransferase n=1 Tax=Thalassobaculum salexigens TaxID=455360 RepID=UPI00040C969E|nr:UbiA family prenyltransferase [Thalassobaculum salexigens]
MKPPICVDLDGTLLRTDLLYESLLVALRRRPWILFLLPFWVLAGRSVLKRRLALIATEPLEVETLPATEDLVAYLRAEKAAGRRIELVSASDQLLVAKVAARFGDLFDHVEGSNGTVNLKGAAKASALAGRHPEGFVYAGDSTVDSDVWKVASAAVPVNAALARRASIERVTPVEAAFGKPLNTFRALRSGMRLHQWAKNVLIFLPLLLTSTYTQPAIVLAALAAFFGFSLAASGTYLLNDLLDLAADRSHPRKSRRALASGRLPLVVGMAAAPALILIGLVLAGLAGWGVLAILVAYLVLTLSYSFGVKSMAVVDVVVLGALFTLRLYAGHTLVDDGTPVWLLGFSMFLFTSLALVKRLVEVRGLEARGLAEIPGRGYRAGDSGFIEMFGITSSVASVLIFMIYLAIEPAHAVRLENPGWLWVVPAAIGFWLPRVWLLARRGEVHDDPVVFALKDPPSLLLGVIALLAILGAA